MTKQQYEDLRMLINRYGNTAWNSGYEAANGIGDNTEEEQICRDRYINLMNYLSGMLEKVDE